MGAGLWAVVGDPNTDSGGDLTLSGDSKTGTVYINNIQVIVGQTDANADSLCPVDPTHCDPYSTEYSKSVFAYGIGAHRDTDSRVCGATTTVSGQSNVFVEV